MKADKFGHPWLATTAHLAADADNAPRNDLGSHVDFPRQTLAGFVPSSAANRLRVSDHRSVRFNRVSVVTSLVYVLGVAAVTFVSLETGSGVLLYAAWHLTLPAGALVLPWVYFLVVPALGLAYGASADSLGLVVLVGGYVVAALGNVVLILGLMTLCRELRDSRRHARARAASASM